MTEQLIETLPDVVVGTGPVSFEDLVAVARDGAAVTLSGEALVAITGPATWSSELAAAADPGVRHLDRLRRSGDPAHPDRDARPAPAVAGALARRRLRARGRARGGPRADAAAALDAGDRATPASAGRDRAAAGRTAHAPGSRRSCASTARSAAPATWRRSSHCALALMGEGEVRDASGTLMPAAEALAAAGLVAGRAGREGRARADQRHRRHARHAGAGASPTCGCCCAPPTSPPPCRSRASSAPTGSSRPSSRRSARTPGRRSRPPTWSRCSPAPASSPRHRGPDCNRVQDAYSLRCSPQVHGRRPRHRRARRAWSPAASWPRPSTTRSCCRTTGGSSPTATSTGRRSPTCSTSSRSSPPTSRRSASGVPTASSTRPATTGCRRSSPTTRASTAAT